MGALDFVHPDDKEVATAAWQSVQGKTVGTPIEIRVRATDGWRLVEIVGANLLAKQPVEGLVLCLRDLTARRRWEIATDDVGRFRSLVHNAASIIMLLDAAGRIESVSAAITRILGHDQELVEGRPLVELATRRDRSSLAAAIAAGRRPTGVEQGTHDGRSRAGAPWRDRERALRAQHRQPRQRPDGQGSRGIGA